MPPWFNQMYMLISVLSNTTINISSNTNFKQLRGTLVSTDYVRYLIKQTLGLVLQKLELTLNRSFDWQTDTKN